MTTESEPEGLPTDRPLTADETMRYWEEKFNEWNVPYGQDKPGKIYREGGRIGKGDPFESDDEHAEFLAFIYQLRRGEL